METSPPLVSVPTHSLVMSAGPFSAAPGNLSSGLGWDPKDSNEWEQIREELKRISPSLSSKAMEENSTWHLGPQGIVFYFSTALMQDLWQSHSFLPFSFEGFARFIMQVWIHLREDFSVVQHPSRVMGCSTIPQAARLTAPPFYPTPEAAFHVHRQMWRYVTSLSQRPGSFRDALWWWCPVSGGLPRVTGYICLWTKLW